MSAPVSHATGGATPAAISPRNEDEYNGFKVNYARGWAEKQINGGKIHIQYIGSVVENDMKAFLDSFNEEVTSKISSLMLDLEMGKEKVGKVVNDYRLSKIAFNLPPSGALRIEKFYLGKKKKYIDDVRQYYDMKLEKMDCEAIDYREKFKKKEAKKAKMEELQQLVEKLIPKNPKKTEKTENESDEPQDA